MAKAAWVPVGSITTSGTVSEVNFSSIPQNYRDLIIVIEALGSGYPSFQFNGDTGSNYQYQNLYWNSGARYHQNGSFNKIGGVDFASGTREWLTVFQVMGYADTAHHAITLYRGGKGTGIAWTGASRWNNSAAINAIRVFADGGNFTAGTHISIYGSNRP